MTVISTWWRSNMPLQRLSGRLSGRWTIIITRSDSWKSDVIETRCGSESHTRPKGALGTPDGVWGPDQLVIRCSRESQPSGPRPSGWASGERERHSADGHKSGVNILQSLFGLQRPLTHKRYNKMRGTYFFKEVFARHYSLRRYVSSIYMYYVFV